MSSYYDDIDDIPSDDKKRFEELDRKYLANELTPEEEAEYKKYKEYDRYEGGKMAEYAKFSLQKHMNRLEELVQKTFEDSSAYNNYISEKYMPRASDNDMELKKLKNLLSDGFCRISRNLRAEHKYIRILVNYADYEDCVILDRAIVGAQSNVNLIDCQKEEQNENNSTDTDTDTNTKDSISGRITVKIINELENKPMIERLVKDNIILSKLCENKHVNFGSGREIAEPLECANSRFLWHAQTVKQLKTAEITTAVYDWKTANINIFVSDKLEKALATEPDSVINLFAQNQILCSIAIFEHNVMSALFSDRATVTASGDKMMNGLPILISDNPGAVGDVVGGIDANNSDNKWWRNQRIYCCGSTTEDLIAAMSSMMLNINPTTMLDTKPTMIIVDNIYYTKLFPDRADSDESEKTEETEESEESKVTEFEGVPVICHPCCPPKHAYFVNTNHLFFRINPHHELIRVRPVMLDSRGNDKVTVIPQIFLVNLTCNNRALQGVVCQG